MPTTYFATLTAENSGSKIVYRKKLWAADGATAHEVSDFGASDSSVNDINIFGTFGMGVVFTPSQGSASGDDLWFSDGTANGTVALTHGIAGQLSSHPSNPTAFNGKVYFGASSTNTPLGLWQSDGTASGTALLKAIYTNTGITSVSEFTAVDGQLYFIANYQGANILGNPNGTYVGQLWKTDGTADGTTMVAALGTNNAAKPHIGTLGDKLVFWVTGSALSNDKKLEITDGTSNTVLFDFPQGSQYSDFGEFNGKAYFSINDGTHGAALWRTDGTAAGTVLVNADLVGATNFTVSHGRLFLPPTAEMASNSFPPTAANSPLTTSGPARPHPTRTI